MAKDYEQYKSELKTAYADFYSNGICPHFSECSKGMEKPKIICDYAARIGKNYGKNGYPKVLMVGKESTEQHTNLREPMYTIKGASRLHYPGTLYTLALILKGIESKISSENDLKELEPLLTYFCLTNYYKCAFADTPEKVRGLKQSAKMKKHCPQLLLKELDILEPDLIVIQGRFTNKCFHKELDRLYPAEAEKGKLIWKNKNCKIELYKHIMRDKPFYILYSYHPAASKWNNELADLKTAISKFRDNWGLS